MIQTYSFKDLDSIDGVLDARKVGLIICFYGANYPYQELYEKLKYSKIPFLGCMDFARMEDGIYNFDEESAAMIVFQKKIFSTVEIVAYDMRNSSSSYSIQLSARDQFEAAFRKTDIKKGTPDLEKEFAIHLLYGLQSGNPPLNACSELSMFLQSVGGSSGGKLDFKHSSVICSKGYGAIGATALIRLAPEYSMLIERVSSFEKVHETLRVTAIDGPRQILEFNGKPAAEEYARLIGKSISSLGPAVFADYTLGMEPGDDEKLITSIMKKNDDLSLITYNDVSLGTEFNLFKAALQFENRKNKLASLPIDKLVGYISFDCVLCYLTRDSNDEIEKISELYQDMLPQIPKIGFGTFSENFCGANVNQTETILAIYKSN
jgi:hypothetical protein